jgi:glutaredoxin-like protein
MALISDDVAVQVKQRLAELVSPVRLAVFSQTLSDPGSEEVKRLVEELAALGSRIQAVSHNYVLDKEQVEALAIARTPGIAIMGAEKDYGIRFYGMLAGHEFRLLLDAMQDVSSGDSGLLPETRAALAAIERPVHIQVFSTPTCPYCPQAVRLAYRFAMESPHITADGVEVTGYPELAQRYRVSSVPKTVVGETAMFVGAGPESMLLEHVQKAAAGGLSV